MKHPFFIIFLLVLTSLSVSAQECVEDCVWPGDLNANGIVNGLDILPLGFTLGEMGPARPNANSFWEAAQAEDWAMNLPAFDINLKHCDADGDGTITTEDQLPITFNFGRQNDDFIGLLGNNLVGDDLYLEQVDVENAPSGTLYFDLFLGSADAPIENLYGIAFNMLIDTQFVKSALFDFSENWIGQGEEVLNYGKFSDETDYTGVGITRLNGEAVDGFGKIGTASIVITDVILQLVENPEDGIPLPIQFENVLAIDTAGNDLNIGARNDSVTVYPDIFPITSSTTDEFVQMEVSVFPNPASNEIIIQTEETINSIGLVNALGQTVLQRSFNNIIDTSAPYSVPVHHLPRGIYHLSIKNDQGLISKQILLE